jgi:acetoacetyl-[acyl-carrier protein] synthase
MIYFRGCQYNPDALRLLSCSIEGLFMISLPVIVGFGGISPAGRSSFHHGYHRMVYESLGQSVQEQTRQSLAVLMNLPACESSAILDNTLVRKIHPSLFDTENIPFNRRLTLTPNGTPCVLVTSAKSLPETIPPHWRITDLGDGKVKVHVEGESELYLPTLMQATVRSAGQLPTGFDPGNHYQSRNHPRGIQMTVFGASDALQSVGIPWDRIRDRIAPDQVSVYAGSGMGQMDPNGAGGMLKSRLTGRKVTSKHCPFSFAEMPADFINAYLLGSIGSTGASMGACASFLYNLRLAVQDIQSGRARVAIVGNSEAPVLPEIMEGYSAMGALATDDDLRQLDALSPGASVNHRRACRPFSTNKGFTIAESAQFIVLMDDALALELGASIHGAISDVFVNADGYKKSISAPGVGNYVTVAKAMAAARSLIGEEGLRHRSFFQAHGTGTPQNRVTESHIINESAKLFGIEKWLVGAVKSYLGHSIGTAAGDQIVTSLGIWESGIFPGITTIDHIAEDVHHSQLAIPFAHVEVGTRGMDAGIINAKGFGGNNATAVLLAPHLVERMLLARHGQKSQVSWKSANEKVALAAREYDDAACQGKAETIYRFDYQVCDANSVHLDSSAMRIDGFVPPVSLEVVSPYAGWLESSPSKRSE